MLRLLIVNDYWVSQFTFAGNASFHLLIVASSHYQMPAKSIATESQLFCSISLIPFSIRVSKELMYECRMWKRRLVFRSEQRFESIYCRYTFMPVNVHFLDYRYAGGNVCRPINAPWTTETGGCSL